MTHASLFSGIGGFDLAAEWAGWTNVFNCEIDLFCQTVLKYHFPNAKQYSDIREVDFSEWRGKIDVLTGGFPCQPFSLAGKRKGTEDERHLWPEFLRAIKSIRPIWVVGENVFGIINWSKGLVFEQVCADLEAAGYEVQPFIIPACSVNAPHKRDRVWFVAHLKNSDCIRFEPIYIPEEKSNAWQQRVVGTGGDRRLCQEQRITAHSTDTRIENVREWQDEILPAGTVANPKNTRLSPRNVRSREKQSWRGNSRMEQIPNWDGFPTQSPVRSRNDGFPTPLDGITVSKWREKSISAYGNAIVPQIAYRIFDTINQFENL